MKKLKLPWYVDLVYLILTIAVPIVLVMIRGASVGSVWFRFTFVSCSAILIAYVFIRRFVLSRYIAKLKAQNATLELNYNTGVGEPHLTRRMWGQNYLIELAINAAQIVLIALVFWLSAWGVHAEIMRVVDILVLISIIYVIAICLKVVFVVITMIRRPKPKDEEPDPEG